MSTQELIERLHVHEERMCFLFDMIVALRDKQTGELHESLNSMKYVLSGRPACVDEAAVRLSELSAELDALRRKLAGVDEKALEVAAAAIHRFREMDESPAAMRVHFEDANPLTQQARRTDARAAVAAYLAAVRDKG